MFVLETNEKIDYRYRTTPEVYVCYLCGAKGVKIWGNFLMNPDKLFCTDCAEKNFKENHSGAKSLFEQKKATSIGGLFPVVPVTKNYFYSLVNMLQKKDYIPKKVRLYWWKLPF